jgi:hypothetical protein
LINTKQKSGVNRRTSFPGTSAGLRDSMGLITPEILGISAEEMGPGSWAVIAGSGSTPSRAWDVSAGVLPMTVLFLVVMPDKLFAIDRLRLYNKPSVNMEGIKQENALILQVFLSSRPVRKERKKHHSGLGEHNEGLDNGKC